MTAKVKSASKEGLYFSATVVIMYSVDHSCKAINIIESSCGREKVGLISEGFICIVLGVINMMCYAGHEGVLA